MARVRLIEVGRPRRSPDGHSPGGCASGLWVARFVFALVALCLGATAQAQLNGPGVLLSRSVSGQFVVQSMPGWVASPLAGSLENDAGFIRLDPTLLPVSCERIKQILWRKLGIASAWKGTVFLKLYPVASRDDSILIESEQFRDGWQYRVTMPSISQRQRYVRAIVSVLMQEFANREAGAHAAELPSWLTEGLARELLASNQQEIILTPPRSSGAGLRMTTMLVNARQGNPLEQAHQDLCAGSPVSFQQLSWPTGDQLDGEPGNLYRGSAQLFVHQLLSLPDGPACVRAMLEDLSRYYNWQFAFQHAFRDTFAGPLEIEKWWSLQLVHFTGRELTENWTEEESWQKLDEAVRSAVQIRIGTNELPLHAEVALQTIIRDWPAASQTQALETKRSELQMLRPRLARDLAPLVDDYCRTIEVYVQTLNHPGSMLFFRKNAILRRNASETLQGLDNLDARRAGSRPFSSTAPPLEADSRPVVSP